MTLIIDFDDVCIVFLLPDSSLPSCLQQRFKQSPNLDLLQLGCEALVRNSQAIGKISVEKVSSTWELPPVDVLMEDIMEDAVRYVLCV